MSKFDKGYAACAALSILAALCLRAPALDAGLLADDWDHYAMSVGIYPAARSAFDHFDFIGSTPAEHAALQRSGRMPWWISPNLHVALLRPLSSVLGEIDYVWLDGGHHPRRMHVHSLAWWVVLVTGVACLLPLLLPLPAAALGTLLYAVEDAQILPVTWVANRSELVANAFVVWALVLQVLAARREQAEAESSARKLWLASYVLVACALLAGEHSIPALAYLVAFQLCRSELPIRARLRKLAPLFALVAGFLIVRRAAGYGAAGLGMYIEPLANPLGYLHACAERLPLLLGDVVFGVAADWYPGGPPSYSWLAGPLVPAGTDWTALQTGIGWFGLLVVVVSVLRLRHTTDSARRSSFWLLLAAAASLVPMCASIAMGRLTLPAALGVDAAWALLVSELARRALANRRPVTVALALVAGAAVLSVHLVGASMRTWRDTQFYAGVSQVETEWSRLDGLDVSGRQILTLTSGCAAQWVIPYVRHLHGLSMPASSTPLSAASLSRHELIRTADNVLELRLPARPTIAKFTDSVYRSSDAPFQAGDRIETPNFEVRVLAADGGEPIWLRFSFPASLDSDRYLFLDARPQGLVPLRLPPVGSRMLLGPPAWPAARAIAQANTTP